MRYRFLFVSIEALASNLAWQVRKEGHEVKFFIEKEDYREIGDGLLEKSSDWRADVDWADVVVFDDALGQGTKALELRRQGKLVIGGTPYTDRLEDDRAFGQSELKRFGIPTIPQADFNSVDQAISYIRRNPAAYVLKPSGDGQSIKRLLFVGQDEDGSDVIRTLQSYKTTWAHKIKEFQLQQRVFGVEVGIGAFFNGTRFVKPVNVNFEHKRLFPDDLGPLTGEMGTTMFWSAPNRLYRETIAKMEARLAEERYTGYFDLNCIVNAAGIWPLEFTPRFGFPTINIQIEGLLTPIGQFLFDLAAGNECDFRTKPGFQIGVRLRLPPYPYDDLAMLATFGTNVAITFKEQNLPGVHIEDVKCAGGQWYATGIEGCPLVIVASGLTMREAQAEVYRRVAKIEMPNMYFRNDIGAKWEQDGDKLLSWGYLDA